MEHGAWFSTMRNAYQVLVEDPFLKRIHVRLRKDVKLNSVA
jgi:hypothetical protein